MDELLQGLLSDPEAVANATKMAQQLMAGSTPPPSPAGGLGQLLHGGGHPLADALGPYIGEARRKKLSRALQMAAAARAAGGVLGRAEEHGL